VKALKIVVFFHWENGVQALKSFIFDGFKALK
jgi:hypothetical protein